MKKGQNAGRTMLFDFRTVPDKRMAVPARAASNDIDRHSPVPLYYQLYQLLLAQIEKGDWRSGAAIPTEKHLSEQYGLSRTTVRQALQQLVQDGCLSRHQGRGTFVTQPKVRHGPQRQFGISGYLRAHGLQPGWRLLGMERIEPPAKIAAALGLAAKDRVLRIRRVRLADKEPIGLHTIYVPFPLAEAIRPEHLSAGDSSLSYLENSLGLTLSESHRIIEAVAARKDEARLLGVKPGAPLLLIRRTTVEAHGKPVEYLHSVYRGDRFEYYVHFEH